MTTELNELDDGAASGKPMPDKKSIDNVALKLFQHIVVTQWLLSPNEINQLLGGGDVLEVTKDTPLTLSNYKLERISLILSIYKALNTLFTEQKQANEWIKKSNKAFDGYTALSVMLQGDINGLKSVRNYLMQQLN